MKVQEKYVLGKESKTAKDGVTKLFRLVAGISFKHKILGEIKKKVKK